MQFERSEDPACFDTFAAEWNALLAESITRVPFLTPEYLRTWWAHRGGGEWPEARLALITARDEAGRLVGIAPLFSAVNRDSRPALLLLGSIEISDYLDLVVRPEHAEAFVAGLLEHLAGDPGWEVLDLYNLQASSPTRAALARAAAERGWGASEQVLEQTPAIPLPTDFETYLANQVEKKERQEIRRKVRRAENGEQTVTWRLVGPTDDVNLQTDSFLELMALNPDKARFLTPPMRAQFRDTVRAMSARGLLHLAFLDVDGEPAAGYLSFDDGKRLYVYNSAIDPRFNALSAGWVLLAYLIQWSITNGRTVFDFLRGHEDYKFRFGGVAGRILRLQVTRAGALTGDPIPSLNPDEAPVFPPEAAQ
ncbi:MAG: GNAT family N-acetyltransferase [Anaerolineales bacterium]|nr:GNAT family N-acetyltransferase [Anaerolineales bacterium]